jgi:hypothetical protein
MFRHPWSGKMSDDEETAENEWQWLVEFFCLPPGTRVTREIVYGNVMEIHVELPPSGLDHVEFELDLTI